MWHPLRNGRVSILWPLLVYRWETNLDSDARVDAEIRKSDFDIVKVLFGVIDILVTIIFSLSVWLLLAVLRLA